MESASEVLTLNVVPLIKHYEFVNLLQNLRAVRRHIADKISNGKQLDCDSGLISLKNAQVSIENCLINGKQQYQADFVLHEALTNGKKPTASTGLKFNIKDELLGVKKDISFLELYQRISTSNAAPCSTSTGSIVHLDIRCLCENLKVYHPEDASRFLVEVEDLTNKLLAYASSSENSGPGALLLDYFLTDWDGTYKTYGCNYATCMQPAYSAIILNWVKKFLCKFVGVLTAGPLKGPGILDLTSLNLWDQINVGGSWGREWLLVQDKGQGESPDVQLVYDGSTKKTVLDKTCFDVNNEALFERLKNEIKELLKQEKFSDFSHIGSGFQQKVDRVTMAIQNVQDEVPAQSMKQYTEALEAIMLRLDPRGEVFEMQKVHLDVEIIVKDRLAKKAWSKRDGLRLLTQHSPIPLNDHARVLLCGDTASDLPMLHYLRDERNVRPLVVFVNPARELRSTLEEEMKGDAAHRLCIVGCPEVLHMALLNVIYDRLKKTNSC